MNVLTNELFVRYDEAREKLLICHFDQEKFPTPLIEIALATLENMTFSEASQFVGERLILLVPDLRKKFSKYFAQD